MEMHLRPLAIDLFCGLGGWAEGFLAEGWRIIGFDNEPKPYPGEFVLQDVTALDGARFARAVANNNVVYVHASRPSAICCAPVPPAGRMRSKRPTIAYPREHPVLAVQRLAAACAAVWLGVRRIVGGLGLWCGHLLSGLRPADSGGLAGALAALGRCAPCSRHPTADCADSAAESAQGTPGCTGCVLWLLRCAHGSIGRNGDLFGAKPASFGLAPEVDFDAIGEDLQQNTLPLGRQHHVIQQRIELRRGDAEFPLGG